MNPSNKSGKAAWIYVATPYRCNPNLYVQICREMMGYVLDAGGFPLCTQPTYHGFPLDENPLWREVVLEVGRRLIGMADGAIFHPAFGISKGMQQEYDICLQRGLPRLILEGTKEDREAIRAFVASLDTGPYVPTVHEAMTAATSVKNQES